MAEDPSYKSIILEFKDIDKFPSTGMWKRAFCTKYRNIARYLSTLSSIVIEDLTKRSRFECPVPPIRIWLRSNTFLFTLVFKKREGLQNGQFVGQSFFSLLKIGTRSGFLRAGARRRCLRCSSTHRASCMDQGSPWHRVTSSTGRDSWIASPFIGRLLPVRTARAHSAAAAAPTRAPHTPAVCRLAQTPTSPGSGCAPLTPRPCALGSTAPRRAAPPASPSPAWRLLRHERKAAADCV